MSVEGKWNLKMHMVLLMRLALAKGIYKMTFHMV